MIQTVEVLVVIDDINKIYYTEDKNFAANDIEAIEQAWKDYFNLLIVATQKGYKVIKREKVQMNEEIIIQIDNEINELGGRLR